MDGDENHHEASNEGTSNEEAPRTLPLRLPTFRFPPDETKAKILEIVDRIKQCDLKHEIDIPELVICGKQSSGKSSVLEAITGLEFPKGDGGPCTRFVIEIRLYPDDQETCIMSKVRIRPTTDQGDDVRDLGVKHLPRNMDVNKIIKEAEAVMNLTEKDTFSSNILAIEYHFTDPDARVIAPRLTLIDLPGLVAIGDGAQIRARTNDYIRRETALIIAVVDAVNDLETHDILKMAQEVDPDCQRTFGIITKPDATIPDSNLEKNWVQEVLHPETAKYFKLGSHVLFNRDSSQIKPGSAGYKDINDRDNQERAFFSTRTRVSPNFEEMGDTRRLPNAWHKLFDTQKWGVGHLRDRLLLLLSDMAVMQVSSMYADISAALEKRRANLTSLEDKDPVKQKGEYRNLVQMLRKLADQASSGNYKEPDFFVITREGPQWLRSNIIKKSIEFSNEMRTTGHKSEDFQWAPDEQQTSDLTSKGVKQILDLLVRTKSGSHPASFNPDRIDLIFTQLSTRWNAIATGYVEACHSCCESFVRKAVDFVVKDRSLAVRFRTQEINKELSLRKDRALATLQLIEEDRKDGATSVNPRLWMDSRELISELNSLRSSAAAPQTPPSHPASVRVGQRQQQASTSQSRGSLGVQAKKENEELERHWQINALELLRNMLTLYKQSRDTYIDNVLVQVVQRNMLRAFDSLFSLDWLDDPARFQAVVEDPDKTNRLKKQERLKVEIDILARALEDIKPLVGKFSLI